MFKHILSHHNKQFTLCLLTTMLVIGTLNAVTKTENIFFTQELTISQGSSTKLTVHNGLGCLVFPLSCRNLSPGKHTLQVEVRDNIGNKAKSTVVNITVTDNKPNQPNKYARAIHILNRFAFGTEPTELAKKVIPNHEFKPLGLIA